MQKGGGREMRPRGLKGVLKMTEIEFNQQMKSYFYELAICDEIDFNIFIYNLENEVLKPEIKKHIEILLKYVKEARNELEAKRKEKEPLIETSD